MALVPCLLVGLFTADRPIVAEGYQTRVDASLPLEKRYTAFGSMEVKAIEAKSDQESFSRYKVWYPSDLETTSAKKYPVVVFANGSGAVYFKYEQVFRHLASWGFVAVGNDDPSSRTGKSTSATLDLVLSLNKDSQSVFYKKLDTKHIGVSGHSQGGVGAANAVIRWPNGRQFASLFTASATSNETLEDWRYDTSKVRVPFFMVTATGQVDSNVLAPLARLRAGFDKVPPGVPAVMARRKNADHGDTLIRADGYMTAWFRYTLMNDPEAKQAFAGKSPEILRNSANWQDVKTKSLDQAVEFDRAISAAFKR